MREHATLQIGVVGCGRQGAALAQAVLRAEGLRLTACADPDQAAAGNVAGLTDAVSRHATLEALLAAADVDAVLIATPHDQLAPVALSAIRAGKHLLIEKPIALDEPQAREVEFAAASAGVTCMVGYSFRFGMARQVFELLNDGAIGELVAITGSIGTPRLDDGWMALPRSGGGPLLYVGSHLIDLVMWLFGQEPIQVSATVHQRDDLGADDTSSIRLDFGHGRFAQLLVTQSAHRFFYDVRVVGRSGSITLRGTGLAEFEINLDSDEHPEQQEPTTIRPADGEDKITAMFVPELLEFADSIRARRAPAVTPSDGRRVLRVLDAVQASSHTTQPVALEPMLAAFHEPSQLG
jgi:predicted dehydrogenase